MFKKTLIIGLGLIGGSIAKAIEKNKISKEIYAIDLEEEAIELAILDSTIKQGYQDLRILDDELASFDLIIIATPLSSYEEIFENLSNKISSECLVIDLGSVKDLKIENSLKNLILCHPIAGLENSGFEYSSADLFLERKFIICAKKDENQNVKNLENFVKKIGANPYFMDKKQHDEIYGLVSHLPQFLSFLTKDISPENIENEFFKSAFRLNNSSPEIWEDIFEFNEQNLEKFYLEFFDNLEKNCNLNLEKTLLKFRQFKIDFLPITNQKITENIIKDSWFIENFSSILFRIIVVISYLEIKKINQYLSFAGKGFEDFTSIVKIINFCQKEMEDLIKKNHQFIKKNFLKISQ